MFSIDIDEQNKDNIAAWQKKAIRHLRYYFKGISTIIDNLRHIIKKVNLDLKRKSKINFSKLSGISVN